MNKIIVYEIKLRLFDWKKCQQIQIIQSVKMTEVLQQTAQGATQQSRMSGTGGSRQRPSSNKRLKIPGQQPADILNNSKTKSVSPTPGAPLEQTETAKNLLTTKKKASKPAYLQSLSQSEKAENFKIIDNMNKKIAYMKNPRYKVSKAPITMTTANRDALEAKQAQNNTSFRVEPTTVNFSQYQVNCVYEIMVKVTNVAPSQKRIKFVPPASDVFTVSKVKYPSDVSGDLATGMSVTMAVVFQAPSFADFDDAVTFVTEEGAFKLPLTARRDPPVISLVNPMNCLNSWLGDRVDMAFRCVNNGGDGGFKFFCERDEDDNRQTEDASIKIGSFTITPSEFYLYSGNAIDVYISFNPESEGQLQENMILACDNQTSEFYKVQGYGAMLDLDIVAVDGKEVDFKANPFETIFFDNTNPTAESRRTLKLKNTSPIPVPFHWSIYREKNSNKINLGDEQTHYRVTPQQGKIKGNETIEFEVFFSPDHAEPYFEYADLIIEDVPISALRSPPEGLKQFYAQNQPKSSKVPMPTYVGSNTQFLSIPIMHFNLRGQGNSCQVAVEPPITFFEGDTFINHEYRRTVQLKKMTNGIVKYKLRLEGMNRDFQIDIKAGGVSLNDQPNGVIQGEIAVESIDLEFVIKSAERGIALAYYYIEIEDGPPISFQCQAEFCGPHLENKDPVINIGLSKVNTRKNQTIELKNTSPIPAEFLIKSSRNQNLNFKNAVMPHEDNTKSQAALKVGHPMVTRLGNKITVSKPHMVLEPHESCTVDVTVDCITEETMHEEIEIMVQDSKSIFVQMHGEIQKPKVYVSRNTVELGKIYAGVKEVVEYDNGKNKAQALELVNYGNLPVKFKWEERQEKGKIVAQFEPSEGIIPPKSKARISFEMTVFYGGAIDELFMCDVEDLELPLGFEVKADAFGLNVVYLTAEEQAGLASTQGSFKQEYDGLNELKVVNFTQCRINKPISQKFILKNLSGIASSFNFNSSVYEPLSHKAPVNKSEVALALEAEAKRRSEEQAQEQSIGRKKTIRFAPGMSMTGADEQKRTRPILSDEHEQTQKFQSASGATHSMTKVFEKEQNFFLQNNKGIAVVFTPNEGELPANSDVPITVTIFNNVCGKFDDMISAQIKGLPDVEFPCRISISGSPVVIPPNQVGLNYNTMNPTMQMPTTVANTSAFSKVFKIKNTGIRALDVDWRMFDQKDLDNSEEDPFSIKIEKNQSFDKKKFPFKFNFTALEPAETKNSAFEISPKKTTVACRSEQVFKVSFSPSQGLGNFQSILLATPTLAQEEIEIAKDPSDLPKAGSLGTISLNLTAETISPYLKIDKTVQLDGQRHIKMKVWSQSTPEAPSNTRSLTFSNDTKADMVFNLSTSGPFEIVGTLSNTGSKHPLAGSSNQAVKKKVETMFCLQPLKIVEVQVKFKAPKPAANEDWPMVMCNERHGELVAAFSNGDTQKFTLEGQLLRPKLNLLTEVVSKNSFANDEMDFGVCNVDCFKTIKVYLSNITEVSAKWSLNYVKFPKKVTMSKYTETAWEAENLKKVDDPDVFEFSHSGGLLKGKSLPLRVVPAGLCVPPVPMDDNERQFLPQELMVNFRPKQNVIYKSKFRFIVENGISCDVILKGKGSYEENHDC